MQILNLTSDHFLDLLLRSKSGTGTVTVCILWEGLDGSVTVTFVNSVALVFLGQLVDFSIVKLF
jgi:hypothetical protein